MPIYIAKAKREVTITEVAEVEFAADSRELAENMAMGELAKAFWREDHTSGYVVENPEIEILVNGDEKLPEEVK